LAARVCPPVGSRSPQKLKKAKKSKTGSVDADTPESHAALSNANAAFLVDYLDLPLNKFGEVAAGICQEERRETADFFCALGSDCYEEKGGDGPATTSFRAIGAGNNEGFLGYMRVIHTETEPDHLVRALFSQWDYSDPPPFMRWDPNEFRPHALRATDPAKDRKHNNVRGANRLAIEALPLFPTVPHRRRLRTVAFETAGEDMAIVWPIWTERLEVTTVASLLACGDARGTDGKAARPGIAQVFRARRFTEGKYRNFSPAKALM
jgi:hypothetical protein